MRRCWALLAGAGQLRSPCPAAPRPLLPTPPQARAAGGALRRRAGLGRAGRPPLWGRAACGRPVLPRAPKGRRGARAGVRVGGLRAGASPPAVGPVLAGASPARGSGFTRPSVRASAFRGPALLGGAQGTSYRCGVRARSPQKCLCCHDCCTSPVPFPCLPFHAPGTAGLPCASYSSDVGAAVFVPCLRR